MGKIIFKYNVAVNQCYRSFFLLLVHKARYAGALGQCSPLPPLQHIYIFSVEIGGKNVELPYCRLNMAYQCK